MNIYRHGDVDIIQINELPDNLKKSDSLILAYGEQTGHCHILVAKPEMVVVFQDEKGNKYFQALEDCLITHEEHKQLEIKKGIYKVLIEKEYNPFDQAINAVKD